MKKFTTIELLVMVAIIGILAAMILPSLDKAREKAKQTPEGTKVTAYPNRLTNVIHDNHKFIVLNDSYGLVMIHHPSCNCGEEK